MPIFTNLKAREAKKHGMFRSTRLKATDVGRLWDLLVNDGEEDDPADIDVDNGVAVKVGDPTHDGLQTRYATIADVKDKVAIVGAPPVVKDAFTRFQAAEYNFYIPAGQVAKAYEVREDEGEIFGVAEYQFTTILDTVNNQVALDNYVVVDGNGGWVEMKQAPASGYGFVGRVYGFEIGDFERIVLIEVVKNSQE